MRTRKLCSNNDTYTTNLNWEFLTWITGIICVSNKWLFVLSIKHWSSSDLKHFIMACVNDCDPLFCDITMVVLQCFISRFTKIDNRNFGFLLQCYTAGGLDLLEYTALLVKGTAVNYSILGILIVYGLFHIIITICSCCSEDIYRFVSVLIFKSICLSIALAIFASITNFELNTIEKYFTKEAMMEDPVLSIVILISLVDICFDMLSLIATVGYGLLQLRSKSFKEIMCSPAKTS